MRGRAAAPPCVWIGGIIYAMLSPNNSWEYVVSYLAVSYLAVSYIAVSYLAVSYLAVAYLSLAACSI